MGKAKPGPKPAPNIKRQPNGQPSRAVDARKSREDIERQTAIDARMRVRNLRESDARSQMAGYPVGRLCLAARWDMDGKRSLTPQQHDALVQFSRLRFRYLAAIGAAKPLATPPSADMVSSETSAWVLDVEDEDRAKANAAVRSRYADARSAIFSLGEGALRAVVRVACDEQDAAPADILVLGQAANLLIGLWSAKHRRAA